MFKTILVLASVAMVASVSPAQAQEPILAAQQQIAALPSPHFPDVIFNEFTIEARVVEGVTVAQVESDFWKDTSYESPNQGEPMSYEVVRKFAEGDSGISAFRFTGNLATSYFVERYVSAGPARDRLAALLAGAGVLGTGYVDQLSDPFGDQLFIFGFGSKFLVVTIHHVYA